MELDSRLRSDSGREEVILGIDKFTGLPKLAIELPPEDVEREDRVKIAMSGTSKGYRAKSEDRDMMRKVYLQGEVVYSRRYIIALKRAGVVCDL